MGRLTRTRRLSIAAVVSLLLFGAMAGTESQSISIGASRLLKLSHGTIEFRLVWNQKPSADPGSSSFSEHHLLGFTVTKWVAGFGPAHLIIELPLWPFLLLLLIAPVRWLIARPANAPAFPVIADTRRAK